MLRHARRALAVLLLPVALLVVAAVPVSATQPGVNGRLAFTRFDDDGRSHIWTANPDMSRQVQVTGDATDDSWPTWSPDGTRIAFQSDRTDPDPGDDVYVADIFTMRADGSDLRLVTDSIGGNEKPAWSPDGRWLVFASDRFDYPRSQGIYRVPSDGSAPPTRVTALPDGSIWQELARFSPDGDRLVFSEYRGGHILRNRREGTLVAEQAALFSVRLDGTGRRQLTPWGLHGTDADWSPDGRKLVFAAQPTHLGNIGDVHVADADGSHIVDLTREDGLTGIGRESAVRYAESFNATWSPDGTRIVFVHASFTDEDGFHWTLETMAPDGSDRHVISLDGFEHQPEWGTAPILP